MNDDESRGDLALAVHRGERGALARLICAYQDPLFGYALRLLKDPADAQEVTQDVFLRTYRTLTSRYDERRCRELKLRPWLFRIARNLSYNQLRSRRSRPAEPLPVADGYHEPALRSHSAAERELEAQEELAGLELALASLGQPTRELVQLRFIEELSYAEVAGVLGGTEASARGKVFRALGRLRAKLRERETADAM